jgi:hypothetical protein
MVGTAISNQLLSVLKTSTVKPVDGRSPSGL